MNLKNKKILWLSVSIICLLLMITAILVATAPRWGEMGTYKVVMNPWDPKEYQYTTTWYNNKLYWLWRFYPTNNIPYLSHVIAYSSLTVTFAIASSYSIYKTIKLFKR
ncbi:hypothetical protein HLA87_02475 [Mycoplasma miroungigenitalium]|uniref:Uncharacterized protein n=1 Tax=Mycoplasma miroungigenitalium TaxID=754515 RepID=A0A6M4J9M3_9MOLU|nr:hypothetical protein [Mycoplasma miroungigenitalium]QJR43640.1 hypothetical protein HLA87_02475 [Mycoplasma miroungigenitalium]